MSDEGRKEEERDFVLELRIRVPRGLLELAERTMKDAMEIAGDFAKIGKNVVGGGQDREKPKLKKVDIK